jgi:prophage regulatory protein
MRLLRIREVIARTGRTRSRIYDDMSKGDFPQPVKIGGQAIAFVEAEVDDWIASKIAARDRVAA